MKLQQLQEAKYHGDSPKARIISYLKHHPDKVYDMDQVLSSTYDEVHDVVWDVARILGIDLEMEYGLASYDGAGNRHPIDYDDGDERLSNDIGDIFDTFYPNNK